MFSAGDARRYPGFFTRTWTPPPENIGHVRSNRSASSIQGGLTHETPPLLTPRLAAPINVRGLAATDSIPRLNNPLPSPTGLLTNSALVGMSREEPSIMPFLSSKQTAPMGMHPTIFAGRRGLADMSEEERMEYTNRLEGDMTHVHNTLSRAYQLRDDYKNEAARLHRELQDKNHRFDCLLREHSACNDVIYRCKRENEELRQKLDESEGEVRQLRDKLVPVNSQGKYVPSGDERHVGRQEISALEEKNKKLEEELLELTKELERERECIRHHAVAAEMRKSENTSHEEELAQSRYLLQVTRTEITDLQQLLRKEREDYEESLREAVQARNNLHQQNTALQEQKEHLQEMCDEQHRTIEDLTSQLLQRKTEQAVQRGAPDTQMETTDENKTDTNRNNDDEVYRMLELQQHALQQQFFLLRREGEAKDILLQKASEEIFNLQNLQQQLEAALQKSREHVAELTKSLSHTQNQLQTAQERITEDSYVIKNFHHQLREKIQISGSISGEKNIPQGGNKEESIELVTRETQMPSRSGNDSQYITANVQHEKLNLPQKADSGHNATGNNKELSSAQNDECEQAIIKHKMTEEGLTEVIEALKTELQHTQKCLREAEEENVQLTNKLNAAGVRGRSTSTTRSGSLTPNDTEGSLRTYNAGLKTQLSSALTALTQLAEQHDATLARATEMEERVSTLEEELRTAHSTTKKMSAERELHVTKLTQLEETVSRLESYGTAPEQTVAAFTTELQHTQQRLREAEEEIIQLTNKLNAAGVRVRTSQSDKDGNARAALVSDVAVRNANTDLGTQLASALVALERLAEEREAALEKATEMEERVSTLEEELRTAHSTTKKMSAERELHVTKLTQLEETVSRLESYGTAPEQTVAAFTAELQHTQQRLREAEEEIIQLTNKLNAAGVRVRTSQSDKDGNARAALVSDVAVRNADTDLGTQLASALVALERLAEEREAALEKATEMEERVSTLEEELRTAHSTTKKMSAERELHVTKLTQLEETVSRLESYGTAPEQTVAAFTAELQHTQQRLREAEEEIIQLTNKLNAAGVRVRTSQSDKDGNARAALVSDVAVRNADTDLGTQLASALVALERLAEEREAALEKATEMEERVSTLEEELRTAHSTTKKMSAERELHVTKLTQLEETVSRLESYGTAPEQTVAAFTTELQHTQQRLREAEEEIIQLTNKLNAAGVRVRTSQSDKDGNARAALVSDVAVRNADTDLGTQLASALVALERLAEEREAALEKATEMEERVSTLEEELRTAHSTTKKMSAERELHVTKLTQLEETVSRLESYGTAPEQTVAAFTAELQHTQQRLREAEEEIIQLTNKLNAAGVRVRTSQSDKDGNARAALVSDVAVRNADTDLGTQLASALVALERLAEEREAALEKATEMEERVSTLEEELRTAHSTTKKMSAERELHVTKLTQLEETVSRLESYGTAPEQTVAAFTTELQHTQQRLREAEEEIIQLTNKLNAAGVRVRTSQSDKDGNARAALVSDVAVRNANTDLGTQLASALVALERLAEEREAALEKATEMEERVSTLEEELRTAHSTTKKMSAERELHVTKLTQLEETVSRLESYGTAPEQTVAAFTAELQHTQQRLREAEEEIIQLTNKLNAAGVRVRTSQSDKDGNARAALVSDVAVRNADTDLGTQLASALVALERLAEEREAALEKATEMEERVSTLEEELRTAHSTTKKMSAERELHVTKLTQLEETVSRLESYGTAPEQTVAAFTAELQHTQQRLREAEEEIIQLTNKLNAAGVRVRTSQSDKDGNARAALVSDVAVRNADTDLGTQLASALVALERLAEEREAALEKATEMEERVSTLEEELRTAHSTTKKMSAERELHVTKLTQLEETVSRLESYGTAPEQTVAAFTAELQHTQQRLREAEEEIIQLTNKLNAAGVRVRTSQSDKDGNARAALVSDVAVRNADTDLGTQLASALVALERLAEEREAALEKATEMEERVSTLEEELRTAHSTTKKMSAERELHVTKLTQLEETVSRLESYGTAPEQTVAAFTAELQHTQQRLREAEEEIIQLTNKLNAAGVRVRTSQSDKDGNARAALVSDVAVRNADTDLGTQLASALVALERLAEEREAALEKATEMEERVSTLEEELRTAHSTTKKMSAERELHVTKLTQLEETVSRLESYGTAPEQTVAAFTTELQHTQQRLREAEEEIIQLTNKLNAAGVRVRTSQSDKDGNARAALVSDVAVRNADTDLGTQLASALVALERLAEEREAALEKATEMEERVSTLEEELRTAHSTTKKMSAERELHVTKLTQLEETVSRLESYGTAPEQTVAAFTAELQHTQQRLREAEEEIIQLTNKLNAAGVRVRTSQSDKDGNARAALVSDVAVRNADTDLGTQLASALVALERLAEEREAALEKATEMEERVSTLEEELRTTKEKLETSVEEISFLKDEVLVSNRLIVDSVSSLNGKVGDSDGAVGADVERLSRVVDELHAQVSATKRGFEEFYDRRSEGCVTELIVARRSVDRSNDARRRLEERNVRLEQDLERKCLEVVKLQKECQRLEQFVRVKDVRGAQSVLGVDSSVDVSSVGAEPVDLEAVDLAQFLQISSLHADLMLCRKTCRQLESNQEELLLSLEQNSSQSNAYLEDLDEIRQQLVEMRQQREELIAERRTLTERVDELGRERGEEVSRLKQQNNSLSVQLQASRNKLSALEASKREGELAARQQAEELAKAFSLMEAQVQTLREEVASTSGSPKRQSGSSRQKAVVEGDEARIRMSQARVTFLEKALQRKDEEVQRLQDELVQKDEQLDQYEQDAAKAAQDAENASRKTLQLESAVQKLQGDKKGLEDELRYAKTRVVTYGGRVSSEVAQHSSPPEQQIRGSPVLGAGRTTRERVSLSVESSHHSRITEQTQRQVRQVMDIRSTRKRSRSANAVS